MSSSIDRMSRPPTKGTLHAFFSSKRLSSTSSPTSSQNNDEPTTKRRRIIDDDEKDDDNNVHTSPSSLLSTTTTTTTTAAAANPELNINELNSSNNDLITCVPISNESNDLIDKSSPTANEPDNFLNQTSTPLMYSDLCTTFDTISLTTKRLEITSILTNFLYKVIIKHPNDLLATIYLCINRLSPEYEGLELGIGETILMKAIGEATGRTTQKIKSDLIRIGDLGEIAMSSRNTQATVFKPKPLLLSKVFTVLKEIATISGSSSQKIKVDKIKSLLCSCRDNEAKYLVRSLEGKLRIGLAERTVLTSLAQAFVKARKKKPNEELYGQAEDILKAIYSELPSYDVIIPLLLQYPITELPQHCYLSPGIPLKPMLAHPTKSISEVLDRFEGKSFICEYKYDGERAQIHKLDNGKSYIFSRNSEDLSGRYPDIMARLNKLCTNDTTSFVLDCEAVAWDTIKQCILPFQVLSTRKRKDVKQEDITVQVAIYAFDLLYLNGKSLIRKSLNERRTLLQKHFIPQIGEFNIATSIKSNNIDDIQEFLNESLKGNCEGIMVKTLIDESSYEPSRRSRNWLKVKKDYLDGMGDSLDLVVIGAYAGKGKRTGVYGGFLLACYDPDMDEYQSICKIGTGFSDDALITLTESLKPHIINSPKSYYRLGDSKADIWFDAVQVWEVKAADLSISPVYQAGIGKIDPSRGISLRFPRFIRLRDDKNVHDATTSEQVADMYNNQQNVNRSSKTTDEYGDD